MKNITFILNFESFGGVETVFILWCSVLIKKYNVQVISLNKIPETILSFIQQNNIKYIEKDNTIKERNICNLKRYILYQIHKIQLNKSFSKMLKQSDVIVDFKNGIGFKYINKYKSSKVLIIHGGLPYFENFIKCDLSKYKKIVILTDTLKDQLKQLYPSLKDKFERIYNPIDFKTIQHKSTMLNCCNIEKGYFLHVSRLNKDKDIKTLIDGYDLFYQKTLSNTYLYIVGDGPEKKVLEQYAKQKQSNNQIIFYGMQENPFPFMKKAKAVVLSSPSEGFGYVLLEGMCCTDGVIVSSDCPSAPREILNDGRCGVLFDTGNSLELSIVLEKIDNGSITRKQFAKNIEKHIKKFDYAAVEKDIDKLFLYI